MLSQDSGKLSDEVSVTDTTLTIPEVGLIMRMMGEDNVQVKAGDAGEYTISYVNDDEKTHHVYYDVTVVA